MSVASIRIELPFHLRHLARIPGHEVTLAVEDATVSGALCALEAAYPMLRGTIRDQVTLARRPFLRFFACQEDLSPLGPGAALPAAVLSGSEPLVILGAIAGG